MPAYHELFPLGGDDAPYRKLTGDHVSVGAFEGRRVVKVASDALTLLAAQAFADSAHLLRPGHLAQLRAILDDPEASANDKFVAFDMLKNANIAAGRVLPMCQDTGTAIVMGKKGQQVWTEGDDAAALSAGIRRTYTETNLRYSQLAPLSMYEEVNTGDNLPAQIDLYAEPGEAYKFLFIAKGGGSANKSFLYQESRAVLNPKSLLKFLDDKDPHPRHGRLSALPPRHRDRRHLGRDEFEDGQARQLPLSRQLADRGQPLRPGLSRPRPRRGGARADPPPRHRRAVRRQVFLPRRAGDPAAAARRQPADRDRRLLLGRPPDPRQDHRRGRVPRRARDQPGALPARDRRGRTRRRGRADRSRADRWTRSAAPSRNTRSRRASA